MSSYYPGSYDPYTGEEVEANLTTFHQDTLRQASLAEIVILEPASFEEVPEAIQALRNQQMVVLNLTQMDFEGAQRSVDFLSGGILMFDGTIEKIDHKIFLFAPHNTEIISNDQRLHRSNVSDYSQDTAPNQSHLRQINNTLWHKHAITKVS